MRRFWGRNDSTVPQKFSRDDEQILALNYENLCDGDYLIRLFSLEGSVSSQGKDESSSNEQAKQAMESPATAQELAEDIMLFGNDVDIGRMFYQRRLQRDLQTSSKLLDPLASQISRQVVVFDHMARLTLDKCQPNKANKKQSTSDANNEAAKSEEAFGKLFSSIALRCCLAVVNKEQETGKISYTVMKPLVYSLLQFFNPELWTIPHRHEIIHSTQIHQIRKVFAASTKKLRDGSFLDLTVWSKTKFQEDIRLSMSGIYGYIALGLLSGNSADILVALNYLMILMISAEEKAEQFLAQSKDLVASANNQNHTNTSGSSSTALKIIPTKVSNKMKQVTKFSPQKNTAGPGNNVSEDSNLHQLMHELKLSPNDDELVTRDESFVAEPALKKQGSGSKLRDKAAMNAKLAGEPQKELVKGKMSGTSKPTKDPKMLHEVLESKESFVNNQSVVVANHVTVSYNSSSSSNKGSKVSSNNRESTQSKSKDNNAEANHNQPQLNAKRFEKEIKETLQASFRLPKLLIHMMNDYCTIIDGNLSTKKGAAIQLFKQQTPASSSASSSSSSAAAATDNKAFSTYVWSCGQNSYGELGLGDINMRKSFAKINPLDGKQVISIGAGNEHSLFVTRDGKLMTAGYNDNGQCGVGSNQQVRTPTVVSTLEDEEIQQVFVYNGCEHTIALTKDGKLYSFGYNYRGQLGLGSTNSESVPRPIRAIMSRKVVLAACSYHHSLFLCNDGTLFSCGRNDSGQLGHGDTLDKKTPQAILNAPRNITSISCGQFHTVASTTQGVVYVCGKNDYGQLGMESSNHVKVLTKLPTMSELDPVVQVCCGYYHTLLLSSSGIVAGFGRNDYGQLGLGHTLPKIYQCTLVNSLRDKAVTMLSAGCYHSIAVTFNGMLYVFGRNNHGQLATGDLDERHSPHPVDDFIGQKIVSVAAGFYHTLVLTTDAATPKEGVELTNLPSNCVKYDHMHEANTPSTFLDHDPKQLASQLRKDLELLCGYELAEKAEHNAKVDMDSLSNVSCRELFTIFVKNIANFDQRDIFDTTSSHHLDITSKIHMIAMTLNALMSILYATWEIIISNNHFNLPLSVDDAFILLRKLLPFTTKVIRVHKQVLIEELAKEPISEEEMLASLDLEDFASRCSSKGMLEALVALTSEGLGDAASTNTTPTSIVSIIHKVRKVLLFIFYESHSQENMRGEAEIMASAISEVLVAGHEVFFHAPLVYEHTLQFVLHQMTIENPDMMDTPNYAAHLKLLIALARVFQHPDQSIRLFQQSPSLGMKIYQLLLQTYHRYSKLTVEKRMQGNSASFRSVDVRRITTVLEQSLYNLTKCAIPKIFQEYCIATEPGAETGYEQIIIEMLQDAESLLAIVTSKHQYFSDESLGLLRFGTVMPSILPTVLLYAIAFAKKGVVIPSMMLALQSLNDKLQLICKYELQSQQVKINIEKRAADLGLHTNPINNSSNTASNARKEDGSLEDEISEALVEEMIYVKREQNQVSWWFRLLKISISLSSRMTLGAMSRDLPTITAKDAVQCSDAGSDLNSMSYDSRHITSHKLWSYCCFEEADLVARSANEGYLQQVFQQAAPKHTVSELSMKICHQLREQEKQSDFMYKMLAQSAQQGMSGGLLRLMEDVLFDTLLAMQGPWLQSVPMIQHSCFKLACNVTKYLHSKRTLLVNNSDGLSWVEILLPMVNIVAEVCSFLNHLPVTSLSVLPLPRLMAAKGSKYGRLWRKAIMLVVGLYRWKQAARQRISALAHDAVDFVSTVICCVTEGLSAMPSTSVICHRMHTIYSSLLQRSNKIVRINTSLHFVQQFMDKIWCISLKSDVLMALIASLRDMYFSERRDIAAKEHISCLSRTSFLQMRSETRSFSTYLMQLVEKCIQVPSFGTTLIELQFLTHVIRLLEVLFTIPYVDMPVFERPVLSLNIASQLIFTLFEKYRQWSQAGEDKAPQVKKGTSSIREKNVASKKALFAMLSYVETVIVYYTAESGECSHNFVTQTLNAFQRLLTLVQQTRMEELFASEDMLLQVNGSSSSGQLEKEQSAPSLATSSALLSCAIDPTLASFSVAANSSVNANNSNKANNKKRCQDLITKPMEFSKSCEGLAIAGERLYNNCKGMDFSVATWMYFTSRSTQATKNSFVMGKISHNEAWPMLSLKSDGKLELLYGHNNDYEKASSEASISMYTWTHVAVVVEQKKIKLFINGVLDSQVTTPKGNVRATLFPLVLGSCPPAIRTRISIAKDGFDGMLAQCKYYSRALSPIHVKVIFDHGPPETIDVSAKIAYHVLASLKMLLRHSEQLAPIDDMQHLATLCHSIYVMDSHRRNRYAALDILQVLLTRDLLQDLTLTGIQGAALTSPSTAANTEQPQPQQRVVYQTLSTTKLIPEGVDFYEALIYYCLRVAGCNWLQFMLPLDADTSAVPSSEGDESDSQMSSLLQELVVFTPKSCFHKSILDKIRCASRVSTPSTTVQDKMNTSEESYGESSFHLIRMLHELVRVPKWKDAMIKVLLGIVTKYLTRLHGATKASKLSVIDMMGCVLFLGGPSSGAFLGAEVVHKFHDQRGVMIQINPTINGAVVLSHPAQCQTAHDTTGTLCKIRLEDIRYDDHYQVASIATFLPALQDVLWNVLDALSPFLSLLSNDFLAMTCMDSSFQCKSVLKCLRPVETVIFQKVLRVVTSFGNSAAVLSRPRLWSVLQDFTSASLEMKPNFEEVLEGSSASMTSSALAAKWFCNMKYLFSVPETYSFLRFPNESEDRSFVEFLQKQVGIKLQDGMKDVFASCAMWQQSVMMMALLEQRDQEQSLDLLTTNRKYLISDKLVTHPNNPSVRLLSPVQDMLLTEREQQTALTLMHHLRKNLIVDCRRMLSMLPADISQLVVLQLRSNPSPTDLQIAASYCLWASVAPYSLLEKDWVTYAHLRHIFSPALSKYALWNQLTTHFQVTADVVKITSTLIHAVKCCGVSLLQPSQYKMQDSNLLASTDFFHVQLRHVYHWIESNTLSTANMESIASIVFTELLPMMPLFEDEVLLLKVLQLCVYVSRKLYQQVLSGWTPSKYLLHVLTDVHFLILRSKAQDQVLKFQGHHGNAISHLASNYTQLVVNLECIQRRVSQLDQQVVNAYTAQAKAQFNLMLAKVQSTVTASPRILNIQSDSFDLDLTACAAVVRNTADLDFVRSLLSAAPLLLENIIIEVSLAVVTTTVASNELVFETVYCGSSHRIQQSGLLPDCNYHMKCRAYFASWPMTWSSVVEFKTEKGKLFSFDPLKCGPDIILSDDGMTASYAGDDTWSTVLASRSFSSGVTSWEIRINQSATAYLFVGVATSQADLNTFLGGCQHGWGFIGEQALYHNREKVKVYGEAFTTGDVIGVQLDLNLGTLSFTKNKRSLGVAFEKIYGDLYPAIAFYNVGQELQIVSDTAKSTCAQEAIPISPARLSLDDISIVNELISVLHHQAVLSHRLAVMIAEHCNQWTTAIFVRYRTVSGRDIFIATESPLLKRYGLVVGERIRTFYGVAEVAGVAYNRVWCKVNDSNDVWFFTNQQIVEGRAKKLFLRCSYHAGDASSTALSNSPVPASAKISSMEGNAAKDSLPATLHSTKSTENLYAATYDAATIMDLLEPSKWNEDMDVILLHFLSKQSDNLGMEPWKITSDQLFENFRSLQQQLSRVVLANPELSHRWGIAGPKRKAVIARLALIRLLNQYLDMYMPFFISDHSSQAFESNKAVVTDDFHPSIETFATPSDPSDKLQSQSWNSKVVSREEEDSASELLADEVYLPWPSLSMSWDKTSQRIANSQEVWFGSFHSIRKLIFHSIKMQHFLEVIKQTATRPNKTEDDYDYPDNLPHVKINRLKAFRAREAAEYMKIAGSDLMSHSMFCQMWYELRQHNAEKLRISYTHPMDDGQSRTFKIKFEGEGVDDYGGPYREIFQQMFTELQLLDPSQTKSMANADNMSALTLAPSSSDTGNAVDDSFTSTVHNSVNAAAHLVSSLQDMRAYMGSHNHHNATNTASSMPFSSSSTPEQKALQCFLPLLMPTPNWTNDVETQDKYKFMFHPAASSKLKMELFQFMGQVVGIAIRSKITIDLAFPAFIWKCIVCESLGESDLASFDQVAYNYIKKLSHLHQSYLKAQAENRLDQFRVEEVELELLQDLTWSVTRSDGEVLDLVPNGRSVSVQLEDLQQYLTMYVEARFQENKAALQMFRKGLVSIIPESSVATLTGEEFQMIVCGSKVIDIQRLKDNTEYDDDVSPEDVHIQQFWEVLTEFSEMEKIAFLKFVWARPSLPPKGVDFTQKMRILSAGVEEGSTISNQDLMLPKAHTCFFSINLPKYSSKQIMTDKIRYAIFNCTEMDGDFRTTDVDIPGWGSAIMASTPSGANMTLHSSQSVELFHMQALRS